VNNETNTNGNVRVRVTTWNYHPPNKIIMINTKINNLVDGKSDQNMSLPQYQIPRFDSNGFDLNVFEELPHTLRSELRINNMKETRVALGAVEKKKKKMKKKQIVSPQIDSYGIDLTVLSQLPSNLRSEIRTSSIKRKITRTTSPRRVKGPITRYTSPTIKRWTMPHNQR